MPEKVAKPAPIDLERSSGNSCCTRGARDFRIRYGKCGSRIGTGDAHEREVTNVYAAGFPSICSSGDGGCDARHGTNDFGGWAARRRNAQRRVDSGLFPRMESSRLSLVRAARIGAWPGDEQVALAPAAPDAGRLGGAA